MVQENEWQVISIWEKRERERVIVEETTEQALRAESIYLPTPQPTQRDSCHYTRKQPQTVVLCTTTRHIPAPRPPSYMAVTTTTTEGNKWFVLVLQHGTHLRQSQCRSCQLPLHTKRQVTNGLLRHISPSEPPSYKPVATTSKQGNK